MCGLPSEDEYWERRREEWENPRAFRKKSAWDEDEPIYENGNLFLHYLKQIAFVQFFHRIAPFLFNLLDFTIQEQKGIMADSAEWNGNWECIEYRYRVA